jgi:hypothetical protein
LLDPKPAAAVLVGEGHAPVVAVLLVSAKADEPISAPKGAPFPHPPMFGLTMRFAANRRVRRVRFSPLIAYLSAKAMPPLGQYFSGLLRRTRGSWSPKQS